MRILVSIATYGSKNREYLQKVINEYRAFKKYKVDITIHGTDPLDRSDVDFIQYDNPKNTVFLHRAEFINKQDDYDYYIFTEDDMLITEATIDTYLKHDTTLPEDYCMGFLRFERVSEPTRYLIDLWLNIDNYTYIKDTNLVMNRTSYFRVTNPHQACYMLSRKKLKYVIANSTYLISGDGLGLETASSGIFTDWYLGTGVINKVLPIEKVELENCLIEHLPGNHCNGSGVNASPEVFKSNTVSFDQLLKTLNLQ